MAADADDDDDGDGEGENDEVNSIDDGVGWVVPVVSNDAC